MTDATAQLSDHQAPPEALRFPAPLQERPAARTRTPAEEARTLTAGAALATLSTLSADGHPWGSVVAYATIDGGVPVICVSTLAEHGRNLQRDPRLSLVVAQDAGEGDPLDSGRVTLAGVARVPEGDEHDRAQAAYVAASPAAGLYSTFGDFTLFVLDVERVRWVGGYGRMDSVTPDAYRAAAPDPVGPSAAFAVRHLNDDHADALLAMAQTLAGYDDATSARCARADRYGLDLTVETPRGRAYARVGFAEPVVEPDGLRAATVELARRARA